MQYKSTLNLPKTGFAMKADLPAREPQILARWEELGLYEQIQQARQGRPMFLLHDGPPYANGDIHIGHALNKILKDLIVRYKTMRGYASPYVPGWDCHGMPIEHQLFKELKKTKHQIKQTEFREQARAYAQKYVDLQREQFKRLGVSGDWAHPYLTMSKDYELTILRTFKELVQAGYIYRGKKPVYWCATCETALAEAEVEYEDRRDTSIYVTFPVNNPPPHHKQAFKNPGRLAVVAWTTTPWTLPANVALCFHPDETYVALSGLHKDYDVIVAKTLATKFANEVGRLDTFHESGACRGMDLVTWKFQAPYRSQLSGGAADKFVSLSEGAGVVHIAPGHGHEDYLIGQRFGLETFSPVDHQGRFTKDVSQFAGQTVFDANRLIIADLKQRGLLLKEEPVTHSYPHCWRCKQPVIFRATPQWFVRVDEAFRSMLLASAKQVRWFPEVGLARMSGMLQNRPDWCLSRQRYWGSPIPVFHCARCDKPLLDPRLIEQTVEALAQRGIEAWFHASPEELVPGAACPCGSRELTKDPDILDVWFDSGVSHEAVLKARRELTRPAQLYLEGSDQHRGWFQVSLITAVALHGRAPYEQVLTHGFVVDGDGRKMSKSLGNVIAPQDVIQRSGVDILRLWVASSDYREDVRLSETILEQVIEAYRKIRNTCRYLLANLYDFQPAHRQPYERLPELDRWALQRMQRLLDEVTQAYDAYQFHQAFRAIYQYCVLELSAFYLDALKDRLYTEAAHSEKRRCAQTSLCAILSSLVRMLAPVLAMTAEEIWQAMRALNLVEEPSVHLAAWPEALVIGEPERWWEHIPYIRDLVMKALEEKRMADIIGSPLEARVTLVVTNDTLKSELEGRRDTLAEVFVVSGVQVVKDSRVASGLDAGVLVPGLADIRVEKAPGEKCQRCWKYLLTVGADPAHPALCGRCATVVSTLA